MTAPTEKVRKLTYQRDSHRCVSCGSVVALEWHHRQATGMGGSKTKPTPGEGLTLCTLCNNGVEAHMQERALTSGWKVRRFCPLPVHEVPVWYPLEGAWFVLNVDGSRDHTLPATAAELIALAIGRAA